MTETRNRWPLTVVLMMVIAALTGVLAPARVAYAASIKVTTTADEINTNGACSLREAIRAANLNTRVDSCPAGSASGTDTITVPAGTYVLTRIGVDEEASLTGDLDVTGLLKINGAGAAQTIIDGNAADRVLNVKKGATLTLAKVTIVNGLLDSGVAVSVNGGGIFNSGTLALTAVTVRDNEASHNGGGIYNNGTLTLSKTLVDNNYTGYSGGGIFNSVSGSATLSGSTISNNDAPGIAGGIQTDGVLTITSSTISKNYSQHGGGGIAVVDAGTARITDSTINDNSAEESGGGLVTYGGSAVLINTTVSGNRAGDLDSPEWGAGVDNTGGSITLLSSTVTANVGGTGGVIGPATLANTIVAGNTGISWEPNPRRLSRTNHVAGPQPDRRHHWMRHHRRRYRRCAECCGQPRSTQGEWRTNTHPCPASR